MALWWAYCAKDTGIDAAIHMGQDTSHGCSRSAGEDTPLSRKSKLVPVIPLRHIGKIMDHRMADLSGKVILIGTLMGVVPRRQRP